MFSETVLPFDLYEEKGKKCILSSMSPNSPYLHNKTVLICKKQKETPSLSLEDITCFSLVI